MSSWQIQQAKQHFSELVKVAKQDGPQEITYRGEGCAWIISAADYKKLTTPKCGIVEFFQKSPYPEIDLSVERKGDMPRELGL